MLFRSYELRAELESNDLETYLLRVGQLNGAHNRVYLTIDRMPARSLRDYQNLLGRLHGVPLYVDQNIAIMNEAIDRGMVQPEVVVDLVIKQIEAQAAQPQATTPLLEAFRRFPSGFPEDQQKKLRDEAVASYEHEFLPAWQKLLDYMKTTYAPKARPAIGLGSLKEAKFDVHEFHEVILRDGVLPLEMLGERGEKYISAR